MLRYRYLGIIFYLIIIFTNAPAQYQKKNDEIKSKLLIFKKQYEALKMEAVDLSNKVQHINFSDKTECLSIANEMVSLNDRINIYSKGIMEYISQAEENLDNGFNTKPQITIDQYYLLKKELDKFKFLFQTSMAMHNTISMLSEFVLSHHAIYLKAGLKYEEVWTLLENETYRQ